MLIFVSGAKYRFPKWEGETYQTYQKYQILRIMILILIIFYRNTLFSCVHAIFKIDCAIF